MPGSAEGTEAGATDHALLAQAVAAYEDNRRDEAVALFDRIGAGVAQQPHYRALAAAVALHRGDAAGGAAILQEACAQYLRLHGRDRPSMLVDLVDVYVLARQADAALAARARAGQAVAARLVPGREVMVEERRRLREIDGRLAALLWGEGRQDEAIAAQLRVAEALPEDPAALRPLRTSLSVRDRLMEALLVQLRLMLLQPEAPGPARDLGQLLQGLGAEAAARAWFRRALALQAGDAVAEAGLAGPEAVDAGARDPLVDRLSRPLAGMAWAPADPVWPMAAARGLAGMTGAVPAGAVAAEWAVLARDAAVALLRRTLALRPGQGEAAAELARLLIERGDIEEGVAALRGALKLLPGRAQLHAQLGFELRALGRHQEAQQSFRTALALDPDLPQAMLGLADVLLAVGPSEQALALLRRARELDPTMPEHQARALRALALQRAHRLEESLAEFRAQLEAAPDDAAAHFGMGLVLLLMGRLEEGWPHYAWRWRLPLSRESWRAPADPLRRPDPAEWRGRTVLVYAEQALGDTIQFLRYARLVAACGARVLLEVPAPLVSLAGGIPDIDGVFSREDGVPDFDVAVSLMDLPWAFGTTLATIPTGIPYLRGDLERAAQFRRRLAGLPGLKVGLVWSGNPRPDNPDQAAMDARRSVSLAALAPLVAVPGVVFVSLQKGEPAQQAASPPAGMVLHDWTEELDDFTATAALMTALDLVISVDTAPAHLAGALGREVWLLNRFDTDFRWLLGRDDSPWYPTMRQFRQDRPGAWDEAIARVADALRERAARA